MFGQKKLQRSSCPAWFVAVAAALCLFACHHTSDDVVVERMPVELKQQAVDPIANQGHAGLTQWFFHCKPDFTYDVVPSGEQQAITVRIRKVQMRIGLSIVQHLPDNAPGDLQQHENGHVVICQRIYKTAGKQAQQACLAVVGRDYKSYADRPEKAKMQALQQAAHVICADYSRQTSGLADEVSAAYDVITMHGLGKMQAQEAVDRAFEQVLHR